MAWIRTVRGDVDPRDLGITYMHEHLYFLPPEPFATQDPDLRLDDPGAAIREVTWFKKAGGSAIVEMTTPDLGRDPLVLRRISETTGVHIIATTGYNKAKFSAPWVADKSPETLAEGMIRDLIRGIDNTDVRAGVIKASSSLNEITSTEAVVFTAAALAHRATGAPISTHTEAGTMALEQIQHLTAEGVPPHRILIGHLDRKLESDYLLAIARTGVYLGFDQIGKEKYASDNLRIDMIKLLIANGHADQIMLSADLARKSYWPSFGFGKGPGLTFILWRFVSRLIEEGIDKTIVQRFLVENPARFLAWVEK
ncbi:phosphotriesterase-related protein [Thermanaerothrix sp. 4228-RoL]|jgi:phosphotriesterase-related protein|uniref:Phosphotriesterase-related protein n=1 Tax=Thermanaerothrix solaris TaxID=3058434 RepID=A0ABU3NK71_9CHLR|nr:phosphotriesterase-related protein [Thermanaerothrix sp. 4228-RoL]MDT8897192.1 phosphotriesterase-related protein [Thermanaerothrix sp. 4228-RoL]